MQVLLSASYEETVPADVTAMQSHMPEEKVKIMEAENGNPKKQFLQLHQVESVFCIFPASASPPLSFPIIVTKKETAYSAVS